MLLNSFNFWLIFPFIFVLYWAIPVQYNRARNAFLLIVSYLLYMNWKPAFAIVLLVVTLITYSGGVILCETDKYVSEGLPDMETSHANLSRRRSLVWCFASLGLLPLLVFKYYNFLNDSITSLLEAAGLHFSLPGLNWAIPVGISFFTFQAVGYLMDVYYSRVKAERNFLDYALFVSFFPQVTSGPISRFSELMPQIKDHHAFVYKQGVDGLRLLLWGMFLKTVVADRLGIYVDTVYSNYSFYTGMTCFVASIFYTFQIYSDFAGYSLMAVSIAKTLGFDIVNNFNRPYFADSITNFWRRWHISLTRWLTTYVYIPLGGNRCSKVRQYVNIMVTFLVSGLWHGANWTFVIWGGLHGVYQIVEKMLGIDPKGKHAENKSLKRIKPVRVILTFLLVNFAWIFFRMPTLNDAINVIGSIFTDYRLSVFVGKNVYDTLYMILALLILVNKEILQEYFTHSYNAIMSRSICRWSIYSVLFIYILLSGVFDSGNFIYVNF